MSETGHYVPGTCNIGAAEIERRLRAGWAGVTVFSLILLFLMTSKSAPGWYLVLFLPGLAAAAGFVQAHYRFCFYFGFSSLFNFDQAGARHHVEDHDARRQDRAKARRLLAVSTLIALVVTLVAYGAAALLG